jgi:hypothetical protein
VFREWYFRYFLGLPDPPSGGAVRGKAVHAIVEYWMRAKLAGVELEPAGLADAWDAAWDQAAEGAQFAVCDDVEALRSSGASIARKYLEEVAPTIEPAGVEVPFSGAIAGVPVRGIVDILDTSGRVIDLKTASRKPSGLSSDHTFQVSTYVELLPGASGQDRIDTLVGTKEPQLVHLEYTPGPEGRHLVERLYPLRYRFTAIKIHILDTDISAAQGDWPLIICLIELSGLLAFALSWYDQHPCPPLELFKLLRALRAVFPCP